MECCKGSRENLERSLGVLLALLSLIFFILMAGGCGSSATDGGVPIGSLSGQVVQAISPDQPVPGALISVVASDGFQYTANAGNDGSYNFSGIPLGRTTMTVSAPAGSNMGSQVLVIDVGADSTRAVVAALASNADYGSAGGVTLSPSSLALQVGQSTTVTAAVTGPYVTPGLKPSLVVSGGVGQVFPNGQFTALHSGSGSLTAAFGTYQVTIPVTVQ